MASRMDKIDELIKNEVSVEVQRLFLDQIISVTQVNVSKDLSYAKVWISALKDVDEAVAECRKEAKKIRKALAEKLILRKTPQLHFVADKTGAESDKIERLIKETHKR